MLEMKNVNYLRKLAHGMPYRHEARKDEIVAWLRKYRPEAEGLPCDEFKEGYAYADICRTCNLHLTQHKENQE